MSAGCLCGYCRRAGQFVLRIHHQTKWKRKDILKNTKNYGFIHLFALSFLIAKLWVDLCLQKRYRLQVVLTLFDQLWGWKSGAASLVWQHFTYQLSSLKLFLHERMLQTLHLPGVLMKSLNEVCLLMLRVQEEDRPAQVAIGIQVHLCPCGTVRAEPIQTYLSQTIWYFLFFTWRFDNQLDISFLEERKENRLFCISCYLKRGTALGAQDRASQAQQILNPIPPVVPPPPQKETPHRNKSPHWPTFIAASKRSFWHCSFFAIAFAFLASLSSICCVEERIVPQSCIASQGPALLCWWVEAPGRLQLFPLHISTTSLHGTTLEEKLHYAETWMENSPTKVFLGWQ